MRNALELVEVDSDRLEEVLRRRRSKLLDDKDAELIRAVFDLYAYVTELVEDKNTLIRRLRQLLFGSRTETTEAVVGPKNEAPKSAMPPDAAAAAQAGEGTTDDPNTATGSKGQLPQRMPRPIGVPCGLTSRTRRSVRVMPAPPAARGPLRYDKAPGRAGAGSRKAAFGGEDLPLAEAALPSVRPGLHRGCARRGRPDEVQRHGRQHDRPVEVRQRTPVQPPRRPAGGPGSPAAGLDPVGHRGGGGREPRSGV